MTTSLFALTNNPARRIVKFALSQEVQDELAPFFEAQRAQFNGAAIDEVPFDGKYKPDVNEVLVIANYDDIDGLLHAVSNPIGVEEINPTPEEFESIKAIFTGFDDGNGGFDILIQHFDRRKVISTNGLSIFHSGNVYKKIEGVGVTIDSRLSAVVSGGNLRFFSFHLLRQIFDLSEYYREATDSDISEFAALPVIKVADVPALIAMSDNWIRRKFALIQQSQILEDVALNEIKAVANEFNIPLNTVVENGAEVIVLPTAKAELKTILRFLDEDYYKSPLSKTQCITNSKRKV